LVFSGGAIDDGVGEDRGVQDFHRESLVANLGFSSNNLHRIASILVDYFSTTTSIDSFAYHPCGQSRIFVLHPIAESGL
jgi:hypothetical protein